MAIGKGEALTFKQEEFCRVYLETGNATEAYRRAYMGPDSKAKESTINREAKRLIDSPKIATRMQELRQPSLDKAQVTQERIIQELAAIAFGGLRDVSSWDANGVILKDSETLTADQAGAVAEISGTSDQNGTKMKIKRHDKVKALELLGRQLGMWNDKVDVNVKTVIVKDYTGRG